MDRPRSLGENDRLCGGPCAALEPPTETTAMPAMQNFHAPLAILAGILFAVLGVSYRLGQTRGVTAIHIIVIDGIAGCLYFGLQSIHAPWSEVPPAVLLAGACVGFSQYLCLLQLPECHILLPHESEDKTSQRVKDEIAQE